MKKFILSVVSSGLLFANGSINLQISNNTLFAEGKVVVLPQNQTALRVGYLINQNEKNFYYAGMQVSGTAIGVNIPVMFAMSVDFVKTYNSSALPLGIGAEGYIPYTQVPLFARAEVNYAPSILSFQKADKFFKVKAEIGATPIENAELFIGYRNINFSHNYNSNFYVGAGFRF